MSVNAKRLSSRPTVVCSPHSGHRTTESGSISSTPSEALHDEQVSWAGTDFTRMKMTAIGVLPPGEVIRFADRVTRSEDTRNRIPHRKRRQALTFAKNNLDRRSGFQRRATSVSTLFRGWRQVD